MKIIFFSNGNVMAFDEEGQQVPNLQYSWLSLYIEFFIQQGYGNDIKNIEFIMPDDYIMIPEKIGPDWIFKLKREDI